MLTIFADVLGIATRKDHWSVPNHWNDRPKRKSSWEIERDLAAQKAREMRRAGLL